MKKYTITGEKPVFFDIEVEAENEEEALDKAEEMAEMQSFVGNGGTGYLCGVDMPDEGKISLFPSEAELEKVEIKELKGGK